MSEEGEKNKRQLASDKLRLLRIAVQHYIDKPGCNSRSRATAIQRLQHAVRESEE